MGDVGIVSVASLASVPRRLGRAEHRVDRGTLVIGRLNVSQA
jgi:hypothetical protein